MTAAPQPLVGVRIEGLARRVVRCFSVSVLTTGLGLATLAVLTTSLAVTAWAANVVATALGTAVSYRLNRRWVWSRHDAGDPWREVVPFWAMSFAGLVLSTVAVAAADTWAHTTHLTGVPHTLTVLTASVAGYAVLWIAQFIVLERVLFAERPPRTAAPALRPGGPAPQLLTIPRPADRGEASIFELDRPSTKERVR
jgi:putative flippase GtrA